MTANQLKPESADEAAQAHAETLLRDSLRALRLHHWRLAVDSSARRDDKRSSRHTLEMWEAQYLLHLGFVKTLNGFFPEGDTADRDAATEARRCQP